MSTRIAILIAVGALAIPLPGQETGEIQGCVTDITGAVVVGARVHAVRAGSNATARGDTGLTGEFALSSLAPGVYSLSVEMDGFRPFLQRRVTVRAGSAASIDVRLQVDSSRQSVRVLEEPASLDLSGSPAGVLIEAEKLLELPLRNGNPMGLALLAPGVVNLAEGGPSRAYDNENLSAISVHGAGPGSHEFNINGAVNTGGMSGNIAHVPPGAAVAEFRVNSASFDARNGFSSGAVVSVGLRQGGNRLHAQFNYSLENPASNANSFFSNKSNSGKDNFRANRWGAYASGPLAKRTFWMYAFEAIRGSQPYRNTSLSYTLPTAPERQGDFSDLLAYGAQYKIYDPLTTTPSTTPGRYTRTVFPGNLIPRSRISKTAANILSQYYPLPNVPGAKPTGVNYVMPSRVANRFQNHVLRLDRDVSAKDRLTLRASASGRGQDVEHRFYGGAGTSGERETRGFAIDNVLVVAPRLALNLRYSYTRYVDNYAPPSAGLDFTSLGFSQTYADQVRAVDPRNLMLPDITPAGYPELNGQAITNSASDIHSFAADLARTRGSHSLRIGGERRVYRDASANTGRSSGKLNFNTNWTRGPLDNSAAAPIGQGLASFLLGLPTDGSVDVNPSMAQQYQMSALYAQDTWRLEKRLTVSFGLRWDYENPVTERYNRSVRGFAFYAASPIASAAEAKYAKTPAPQLSPADFHVRGGLLFAGVGGQPRRLWQSSHRNFAPRAGIAWMVRPNLAVRAGYGMFYDPARQNAIQAGFSRATSLVASQDTGQTYIASLENPFPNGFAAPTGSALGLMTNVGQSVSVFPDRLLNSYTQRWQVSVQKGFGRGAVIQVGYAGSRATHLRAPRQLDALPLQWLSASPARDNARYALLTTNVSNPFYPLLPSTSLSASMVQLQQLLRPYPQFTGVNTTTNEGFSWYHGLESLLQKRFRNCFALVSYTWSKNMEAIARMNEADPAPAHSISSYDRSHRLAAASVYELPFGRRAKGLRRTVAAGWQLQAIYQRQSGAPLAFGNVIYYGGNVHDIGLPTGQRRPERWFNTANFERLSANQLAYNLRAFPLRFSGIRSMGLNLLDFGMSKNLRLAEKALLQIRADAFNCLNHTHYAAPNTSPTSTDFGAVAATSQLPRNIEFGARLQF